MVQSKGEAQAKVYRDQVAAFTARGVSTVEVMKAISTAGLEITPGILVGGGGEGREAPCSFGSQRSPMTNEPPAHLRSLEELERKHGIPPDKYCGLTPADMSRVIVAYHAGPREPGQPVGYMPVGSGETRLGWLRDEFGPEADVERMRLQEQFFGGRIDQALTLDWMLPNDEFDRLVRDGLARHYPELTEEARQVIAGNYSYSHAK